MRPLLLLFLFAPQAQAEDAKAFAQRVLDADAMGWTKAHVTLRLTITDKKTPEDAALEIKGATSSSVRTRSFGSLNPPS